MYCAVVPSSTLVGPEIAIPVSTGAGGESGGGGSDAASATSMVNCLTCSAELIVTTAVLSSSGIFPESTSKTSVCWLVLGVMPLDCVRFTQSFVVDAVQLSSSIPLLTIATADPVLSGSITATRFGSSNQLPDMSPVSTPSVLWSMRWRMLLGDICAFTATLVNTLPM